MVGVSPRGAHPYFRSDVRSSAADSSTNRSWLALNVPSLFTQSVLSSMFLSAAILRTYVLISREKNARFSWSEGGPNPYLLVTPFATMQHAVESRLWYHDIPCIPHEIRDFVHIFRGPYIEPIEDFLTSINWCLWRHTSSCAAVKARGRPCTRLLGGLTVPLSIMLFLNRRTVRVVHRPRVAIISCGMLSSRPCLMLSVRSLSNLEGIPTIWAIRNFGNGPERWERREKVESMKNSKQFGIRGGADKSFDLNCIAYKIY